VSNAITLQVPKFGFELYGSTNVLINPNNPNTKQTYLAAYRLISRRFQINFGVIFEEPPVGYDNYQNLNGDLQEEVSGNDVSDKDRKKARAIYTALKTGVFMFRSVSFLQEENYKLRYYLQDKYNVKKSSSGKLVIYLIGNIFDVIKIFKEKEDGTKTLVKPNSNLWFNSNDEVKDKIIEKFKQFDINIKIG
jgi:hypothetical protein